MPELPEVEVSRRGLLPVISGQRIVGAISRVPKLRHAIPANLGERLAGLRVDAILRRGKYILLDCQSNAGGGWLIIHLGMSGSLGFVAPGTPPVRHDHFDLCFTDTVLRLHDPRRFGTVVWHHGSAVENHPLLTVLGVEPLSDTFTGDWLYHATRQRRTPIKPLLMDSHFIVGVGNIYAAESLFRAGIAPTRAANRISRARCERLVAEIRATLGEAIAAGGSSVRNYVHSDGGSGHFQLSCTVYGRTGQPCVQCGTAIKAIRQGGRTTFYCPACQR